jgi:hypothetical protein
MSDGDSDDGMAVDAAMKGKRTKTTTKDRYRMCIRDAVLWFKICELHIQITDETSHLGRTMDVITPAVITLITVAQGFTASRSCDQFYKTQPSKWVVE